MMCLTQLSRDLRDRKHIEGIDVRRRKQARAHRTNEPSTERIPLAEAALQGVLAWIARTWCGGPSELWGGRDAVQNVDGPQEGEDRRVHGHGVDHLAPLKLQPAQANPAPRPVVLRKPAATYLHR